MLPFGKIAPGILGCQDRLEPGRGLERTSQDFPETHDLGRNQHRDTLRKTPGRPDKGTPLARRLDDLTGQHQNAERQIGGASTHLSRRGITRRDRARHAEYERQHDCSQENTESQLACRMGPLPPGV